MRNFAKYLPVLLILGGAFLTNSLAAQLTSRSKAPIPVSRASGITDALPCNGSILFSEDFELGIPSTWTIIDGDDLTPRPEMGLGKGWQAITDYRDTTDHVAASPSWYINPGKSNDWIITPAITVGTNSCLSWNAYSQDQFFGESYEVRIATTVDTAAFLANPALATVANASGTPGFSSASLSGYAGQVVYIAFRQTSDDKFVLVLDDVQVSNVNTIDIGAFAITLPTIDLGDTVALRFEVANYGSDTITSFLAVYQVAGLPAKSMAISAVSLPPNQTVFFNHDSLFYAGTVDENLTICAWTNLPNSTFDLDNGNDTTCTTLTVGSPVGRPDPAAWATAVQVYPNPFEEAVTVKFDGLQRAQMGVIRVLDLEGRIVFEKETVLSNEAIQLDMPALPAGFYLLSLSTQTQSITRKLMRR